MPTSEYLLEQAARCRRLAAHLLDRELRQRLLDLAGEYERKAAEMSRQNPDNRLRAVDERADVAEPVAGDLENETTGS